MAKLHESSVPTWAGFVYARRVVSWRAARRAHASFVVDALEQALHERRLERDRVLATASFAATRQGYRQMLAWMRSFSPLRRVGVESTGSCCAGLLRFLPQAGVKVLEVTSHAAQDRR